MDTVVFSLLFDKYCLIIVELGLKDSSRGFRLNCVISFIFYLYLMLHACVQKFDVTEIMKKIAKFFAN